MRKNSSAFTLIEILIAMTVLLVGLVGILALFPVGLDATRKAIEDSNAAFVAESAYASLRSSVKQMTNTDLTFFHDGMPSTFVSYAITAAAIPDGQSIGIPCHDADSTYPVSAVATGDYDATTDPSYCQLGEGVSTGSRNFNLTPLNSTNYPVDAGSTVTEEWQQLNQYSFNIQLSAVATNPRGLYDVVIRVRRGKGANGRLVKKFYTQIAILN
jgi:prepilin-type N-terminal cleavage/methylation domain-containing protein